MSKINLKNKEYKLLERQQAISDKFIVQAPVAPAVQTPPESLAPLLYRRLVFIKIYPIATRTNKSAQGL